MTPSWNGYKRMRWSVEQRQKARTAAAASVDYEAERKQKLAELRILATSLEPLPHMATALATVRAEIRRLERNKP